MRTERVNTLWRVSDYPKVQLHSYFLLTWNMWDTETIIHYLFTLAETTVNQRMKARGPYKKAHDNKKIGG